MQVPQNKFVYPLESWSSREFSSLQSWVSPRETERAESILVLRIGLLTCVTIYHHDISVTPSVSSKSLWCISAYHAFRNFSVLCSDAWQLSRMNWMHLSLTPARRQLEEGLKGFSGKSKWSHISCYQCGRMELGDGRLIRIVKIQNGGNSMKIFSLAKCMWNVLIWKTLWNWLN